MTDDRIASKPQEVIDYLVQKYNLKFPAPKLFFKKAELALDPDKGLEKYSSTKDTFILSNIDYSIDHSGKLFQCSCIDEKTGLPQGYTSKAKYEEHKKKNKNKDCKLFAEELFSGKTTWGKNQDSGKTHPYGCPTELQGAPEKKILKRRFSKTFSKILPGKKNTLAEENSQSGSFTGTFF